MKTIPLWGSQSWLPPAFSRRSGVGLLACPARRARWWGRLQPAALATWFVVLAAAAAAGCGASSQHRAYEYMPDMARDPAYKAYAPNPVTRDGLTLQLPVAGTIPRGYVPFHYGAGEQEAARAGRELANPLRATPQVMQEGWALYQTYCLVCHGKSGRGDGPVAERIPHPPSYASDRVMQFPPGRLFHVITMGAGKMRPYAAQLSAAERWKIVTYVRIALQQVADQPAAGQPGGKR